MPIAKLDTTAERVDAMGRSAMYALLSLALAYPSEERFSALRDEVGPLLLGADTGDEGLNEALADLLSELPRPLESLQQPFIDLFTHTASPDCPTYETAFSERDVFRQAQEMADLAGFYRAWGVDVGGPEPERPDHIGPQLEFMSLLARKELGALERGDSEALAECRRSQKIFLRDHLGCWGAALGARIEGLSTDPFYRAVGTLLAAWLPLELEALAVTPARHLDEPLPLPPPELDDGCGAGEGCIADEGNAGGFVDLTEIG